MTILSADGTLGVPLSMERLPCFNSLTGATRVSPTLTTIKRLELHCVRDSVAPYSRAMSSSRDVAALLTSLLGKYDQERFVVLLLDAKNRVTGYTEAARGGVSFCALTPNDVFRVAVHQGAVSVIVAHNHPSQDPQPSDMDTEITKRIVQAGAVLGIQVLDHVIVTSTPQVYYSFCDNGLLTPKGSIST